MRGKVEILETNRPDFVTFLSSSRTLIASPTQLPNLESELTYTNHHPLEKRSTTLPCTFPNDPRSVLPTSSSPFPSFNNEKAKTVSKEASVYFGFCSLLRAQTPGASIYVICFKLN